MRDSQHNLRKQVTMSHLPRGRAGLIRPSLVQTLEAVRLQWFGIYGGVPGEDLQGQGLHTVRSRKDARKMAEVSEG